MSDLNDLEGRITAALERAGQGLERLAPVPDAPPVDADAMERLRETLEAEKTANAQLEERVRALRAHRDEAVAEAQARVEAAEAELAQLRAVNDKLREANRALREANAESLGDAAAIDAAMAAELETLRSLRAGDRAELDAILAELEPLTGEKADA